MVFFLQGCYVSWQFIATLYLQNVQHWSPVEAGLVFAPGGLVVLATAQFWARLVARHGPSLIAIVGIALMIAGNVWSLELGRVDSVLVFALATTISGFGFTRTFSAANISAVAGAPQQEQGLASGLFLASFQVGAGVILGVVASVFNSELHTGTAAYRYAILTAIGAAVTALIALTGVRRRTAAALSPARTAS